MIDIRRDIEAHRRFSGAASPPQCGFDTDKLINNENHLRLHYFDQNSSNILLITIIHISRKVRVVILFPAANRALVWLFSISNPLLCCLDNH
jgi:hypothetical protein